jgi:predicted enzyme related to lactoylglutathione lyase
MITKVTHLSIFVNNQDDALEFYTKTLGFALHTDALFDGNVRWLTISPAQQKDFEITLMQTTSDEQKALVGKQAASIPLFCVETDDCRKSFAEFKNNGVQCVSEPEDMPWGICASIKDLYGNIILVVEQK